jgi:hypothetical protein
MKICNLGRALTILIAAERVELELHEDVARWHATSECHGDVSRGEAHRKRLARRRAEAAAGCSARVIWAQTRKRISEAAQRRAENRLLSDC